jgi:Asp/Glu/hydantoin racemase
MRILLLNQAPRTNARGPAYDVASVEKQVNSYASPGTRIEIGFPDDFEGSEVFHALGGQSNLNGLHHMVETPAIVRRIVWAAENGYDAVISSNTFDPGVDGGRLAVDIPVIGPLRTAMHAGLTLADRVGITVPLASHLPYTRRILRSYGLENFVTGIKPIGVYGKDVKSRKAEIFNITAGLIRELVDDGAEIIVPLGGALIPYVVEPADLAAATGVQVLNTKAICVAFAEMCVRFGMTQSSLTYPRGKLSAADFTTRS